MHSRELAELGALVAVNGPMILRSETHLGGQSLDRYWTTSKCRIHRWTSVIKQVSDELQLNQGQDEQVGARIRPVAEEVLLSELLTRIWAALTAAVDHRDGSFDAEPITRSILISHLEVRNRVLALLVHHESGMFEDAVELNRLRRRLERWTDMLLAHMFDSHDVREFAFHSERIEGFADDLRHEQRQEHGRQVWDLTLASLRAAFQQGLSPLTANADINQSIAASVLGCLPAELFDSTGTMKSLWVMRMQQTTEDTQGMIDKLISLDDQPVRRF